MASFLDGKISVLSIQVRARVVIGSYNLLPFYSGEIGKIRFYPCQLRLTGHDYTAAATFNFLDTSPNTKS